MQPAARCAVLLLSLMLGGTFLAKRESPSMYEGVLAVTFMLVLVLLVCNSGSSSSSSSSSSSQEIGTPSRAQKEQRVAFKRFQRLYLAGFLLAMASDWLHGPYIYALYESYGMRPRDIAHLFIGGFGSSMIFGTFVGALADRWGRKRSTILFCAVYLFACVTKHIVNFWVLLAGRVLAGIACSLLFSVFEAWMVCAHKERGFPEEWIEETFYLAHTGNGLVGALAGIAAQVAADATPLVDVPIPDAISLSIGLPEGLLRWGGFVSPFDLSSVALVACAGVVMMWRENYGGAHEGGGSSGGDASDAAAEPRGLLYAMRAVAGDRDMLLCGIAASAFEAAMFIFVFMWTPALESADRDIPHGVVFSSFMLCSIIGAQLASHVGKRDIALETRLALLLVLSAATLFVPVFAAHNAALSFAAFCVFEMCIGAYWPMICTLRSALVPEAIRSSVYSLYRVPLNLIVLLVLFDEESLSLHFIWAMCATLLLIAAIAMGFLGLYPSPHSAASRAALAMEGGGVRVVPFKGSTDKGSRTDLAAIGGASSYDDASSLSGGELKIALPLLSLRRSGAGEKWVVDAAASPRGGELSWDFESGEQSPRSTGTGGFSPRGAVQLGTPRERRASALGAPRSPNNSGRRRSVTGYIGSQGAMSPRRI